MPSKEGICPFLTRRVDYEWRCMSASQAGGHMVSEATSPDITDQEGGASGFDWVKEGRGVGWEM